MIREAAGEGSRPIRTRKDTRTLGQKMKAAKSKGEPTSLEELKKRKVEVNKPKTLSSKQAMGQAKRSIKKQQDQAVSKLTTKEMAQKAEINKAVKEGQITKEIGDNLKSKIETDFNKAKENIVESISRQTQSTARKIKADPMQYAYRKKGGKVSPRGCGAAMRGFGKAMKGGK